MAREKIEEEARLVREAEERKYADPMVYNHGDDDLAQYLTPLLQDDILAIKQD
jgi:hypothetical protein